MQELEIQLKRVLRDDDILKNSVIERFFRSLKTERFNHLSFKNHQSVICEVENYIQFFDYTRRNIDWLLTVISKL